MRCNSKATKLFSFCDLHTRSAYQILSESLIGKVLSGKTILKTRLQISDHDLFLSAQPVYSYGKFTGALLKISHVGGTERSPDLDTKSSGQVDIDDFIGESPVILQIKEMVKKLSRSDSTILITGETGTGKSLLAKALHYNSKRSAHPFVQLNCASIPESLFESELFGYYEGAFTGAQKGGKPGWFEAADQGTLFLDEIGAMPQNLQAKLLNVLQDNTLQRLGGIRTIPFDVRVIAATNKDIETLVREKQFRADLYYRINVIPLDLPPLCERKSDIALFCSNFLKRAAKKAGKSIEGIDPEVMDLFYSYDWPGNIRELSNIIEFAINMAQGRQITIKDLPKRFLDRYRSLQKRVGIDVPIKTKALKIQAETIQTYLDKYGYDVQGKKTAARELGISLRTLYRKLATQKIDPPEPANFSA
jgi:transcriptional regulator with PAS, ATPase and Fis domain